MHICIALFLWNPHQVILMQLVFSLVNASRECLKRFYKDKNDTLGTHYSRKREQDKCYNRRSLNVNPVMSKLWLQLWRREMPHLVPSIPVPDSLQPPKGIPRLLTWQLGIHAVFFVPTKELDVIVVQLDAFKYWNNRVWLVYFLTSQQLDQTVPTWKDIMITMIQWQVLHYGSTGYFPPFLRLRVPTMVATIHNFCSFYQICHPSFP